MVRKMGIGFIVFIVLCLILFIIYFVKTTPLFYISILTFLFCIIISYELRKSNLWKAFFFNLGILILLGGVTEAYLTWFGTMRIPQGEIQIKEDYLKGGDYFVNDSVRGYAAGPNVRKKVKKFLGEKVIYDVIYTTNPKGLRVAPHDIAKRDRELKDDYKNVIFFGGSFSFGEGLNDDETLPYLFEKLSGGRYQVYNFGFHGYGTQQMLRIIETGLLEKIIPAQQPMVVIYEALISHIERVTGKMIWTVNVPRYKLSPSGMAKHVGTFADDPNLQENLKRSKEITYINSQLLARLMAPKRTQEDIKLFVQIVLQSKIFLEKKYKAKFFMLIWNFEGKEGGRVVNLLRKCGIEVITVDQVFKEYKDPFENYLIEGDYHPTKLANERIAKYLLEYVK